MKAKFICDHANTEHCKKVKKIYHGCWHSKVHDYIIGCHTDHSCRDISGTIKVNCKEI
jgi:argininosuccinate synthase